MTRRYSKKLPRRRSHRRSFRAPTKSKSKCRRNPTKSTGTQSAKLFSFKKYNSTKGVYFIKRFKDPNTGKSRSRRVYVTTGGKTRFGKLRSWTSMNTRPNYYAKMLDELVDNDYNIHDSMRYIRTIPKKLEELGELQSERRKRVECEKAKWHTVVPNTNPIPIKDKKDWWGI